MVLIRRSVGTTLREDSLHFPLNAWRMNTMISVTWTRWKWTQCESGRHSSKVIFFRRNKQKFLASFHVFVLFFAWWSRDLNCECKWCFREVRSGGSSVTERRGAQELLGRGGGVVWRRVRRQNQRWLNVNFL